MGGWVWRVLQRGGFESRAFPGTLDHGKFWTTVLLLSVIVAQYIHNPFPVLMVVTLGSLAYGKAMWSRFLESKIVSGTATANLDISKVETTTRNLTHAVIERIDRHVDADGVFTQSTLE